ncbi:unnamed protein product [Peronospora destructor]|nr:unnamed protein product [Peronospora destructor]
MLEQRDRRRENRSLFEDLVHLANTHQPVQFDRFKQRRSHGKSLSAQLRQSGSANAYDVGVSSSSGDEEEEAGDELNDETINTELLEAYIAYSKSIGNEPNIQLNPVMILHRPRGSHVDNDDEAEEYEQEQHHTIKLSYIYDRPVLKEREKLWTGMMGTRFSKHRGCVQFWTWLLIGVGVLLWLGISLSSLQLNEVLHLDAFTVQDVQVTGDYTANPNSSYFNALLLNEDEYEHYIEGEPFEYIEAGTTLRTTYAYLAYTYIDSPIKETMYFVLQPCYLERNPTADYCQTGQLPTSLYSDEKIYNLEKAKVKNKVTSDHFNVTYMSVNRCQLPVGLPVG